MLPELELRSITKQYPGVVANDRIDLVVRPGEVHAIVGENGAGKSTLMSILYGLVPPDEGDILVRGESVRFRSPLDAIEAGLGMVHQSFQLFPTMTVAENVVYGAEPRRGLLLDRSEARRAVSALADRFGIGVDVDARIEDLGVGTRQRVEILKVLYRNARVLILDEPTAVLTPQERDALFEVIGQLREAGRTILFITHKLNEVMATSDRVTVLRRGRVVAEHPVADTTPAELAVAMTGRFVDTARRRPEHEVGHRVLTVTHLVVDDASGVRRVDDVGLHVDAGEIVGIAGVTGSGQTELVEALMGMRRVTRGTIRLHAERRDVDRGDVDRGDVDRGDVDRGDGDRGDVERADVDRGDGDQGDGDQGDGDRGDGERGDVDLVPLDVRGRRDAGVAYVPEDRHRVGSAGGASAADNLLMGYQWKERFRRRRWLRRPVVLDHASSLIGAYDIHVSGPGQRVRELSGGNLQKVVVAREMGHDSPLLVVEQPTRGVDVGAIEFIHGRIIEQRDRGRAIVLVSTELWEILALSTRILVMFSGRIVAELDPLATDEAEIGLYMTGALGAEAADA